MRIAIYSGAIPSTTFIENLIVGVAEKGHEVLLFGNRRGNPDYRTKNIKVFFLPSNIVGKILNILCIAAKMLFTRPRRLERLYSELKSSGELWHVDRLNRVLPVVYDLPDIFHVQWSKDVNQWAFLKAFGVKLIVSFRGTQINTSPICNPGIAMMYREILPEYDAYHCVSYAIMNEGSKYGASKEKSVVIYPAVKKDLISRSDCKRESTLRILSVGRDHWKKGYRVALDAMKILKDEDFRFHYTIVSGGEKEELIHQIHQLGLSDCVTLIDNLPHASVIDKYRKSDVFLLPSFEEGVANVVLEAMALGVPVISTDCGGMAEVIRDGENGFLIPLRNPQAIRDAIMKVSCLDTARTEDIISNAHDTIRKRHIVDIQVEQMLKLYRHVKEA